MSPYLAIAVIYLVTGLVRVSYDFYKKDYDSAYYVKHPTILSILHAVVIWPILSPGGDVLQNLLAERISIKDLLSDSRAISMFLFAVFIWVYSFVQLTTSETSKQITGFIILVAGFWMLCINSKTINSK